MRLFTAIDLPSDILDRLERLLIGLRPEAMIKWSPLDNLHITTKFIGDWPDVRLEELKSALRSVPSPHPFDISLQDIDFFPDAKSPRVCCIGILETPELTNLAKQTDVALGELGVAAESKPYVPHLTLARIKYPVPLNLLKRKIEQISPIRLGSFTVKDFSLVRSDPGSNSSIYRKMATFPFERTLAAG